MALKNLTTETMVSISAAWTDKARERGVFEKSALLKALLPTLDAAHAQLIKAARAPEKSASELRLAELRVLAEEADRVHDRKARGIFYYLTGLAELAEDPKDTEHLVNMRDRLLPQGLVAIAQSYAHEAGHTATLRAQLTAQDHGELKRHRTLHNRTIDDELNDWLAAGEKLGRVETERGQLLRGPSAGSNNPGEHVKARYAWIRIANALTATLDILEDVDAAAKTRILGPLLEAESRADRRRPSKSGPEPTPAPAPANDGDDADPTVTLDPNDTLPMPTAPTPPKRR